MKMTMIPNCDSITIRVALEFPSMVLLSDARAMIQRTLFDEIGAQGCFILLPDDPFLRHAAAMLASFDLGVSLPHSQSVCTSGERTTLHILWMLQCELSALDESRAMRRELDAWKANEPGRQYFIS